MSHSSIRHITSLLITLLFSSHLQATNGYFSHGLGIKSKGMGGAGIAHPQDALAGASNPASMALVGNRIDIGMDLFRPQRSATITGSSGGFTDGYFDANESEYFPVPEFGYNKVINDDLTVGVSIFGHGGMNVDYDSNIPLFGNTNVGTDMSQVFVVPSLSYKVRNNQFIGVGLNIVGQRLQITGAQNFAVNPPSVSPGNVTNRDYSYSFGGGLRFGWLGRLTENISLGATYQTRTYMSEFDEYKGLLAENGDFDIPANYGIGVSIKATPKMTIAADVVRIEYGDVAALSNSINNLPTGGLGSNTGAGFGWDDQTIWKIGMEYQVMPNLTLRAGLNYGQSLIKPQETAFNIFAPATVEDHYTLGLTWALDKQREISISYMHAYEYVTKGSGSLQVPAGGPGEVDLKMYQDSLGLAMSWKL